ncbi:metal ABC transporter solute-binding protein, Zn/Mn family [uncultured Amnibacterium sp.]|uniref:metal ABC transporter solute-binding protein, Zn/Mn family n=1 Tax=uncultured Amnibacterium sp. TaxID=1631851 RepID=UPI0035CB739A
MHRTRTAASVIAVATAAATVLLVTSCASTAGGGPTSSAAGAGGSAPIGVVAGENFWGDIASQIGGDRVTVRSIISDPDADPHEYESDAADASALSTARLVIENGIGYDDFMATLLSAQPNRDRAVLSVQKILNVTGSAPNPHIWYDTARIPTVAHAIEQRLAAISPADASTFAANEQKFDASLRPINATIATIKAKYAGTKIAYTERVPGYLTTAAGLTLGMPAGFTEAVEQGNEPSPADNLAFENAIKTRAVKVLLYNGQVTDEETTRIKQLADSAGVPVVGVTETIPKTDKDYQSWQLRQAKEILAALGR